MGGVYVDRAARDEEGAVQHRPAKRAKAKDDDLGSPKHYRSYRVRLRLTHKQRRAIMIIFRYARLGFNLGVEALRAGTVVPGRRGNAQTLLDNSNVPTDLRKDVWASVFKNGVQDADIAWRGNLTKVAKGLLQPDQWHVKPRSVRDTPTEVVRLDAAHGTGKNGKWPNDTGPVKRIMLSPGPVAREIKAHVFMGALMEKRGLGPLVIKDRRWLIERLAEDHWLRTEAKLQWDKRAAAFYLIVVLPHRKPTAAPPPPATPRVVAMDPGVRRFQQLYDPDTGNHDVLLSHYHRIDHHNQVLSTSTVREELDRRLRRINWFQPVSLVHQDAVHDTSA